MSLKKIKESELKDLLDEVAADLAKAFESEKDKLVKAESLEKAALAKDFPPEGEEKPESSDPSPDAGPSPSPEASSAPDMGSAPPPPDASAPPMDASAAPAPDMGAADPAAAQGPALTPEVLQAEYAKLAPEELDMHLKAALAAKAALAGPPDASAGAPPMDASASAPPAPDMGSAPPAPAMKNELPSSPEREGISKSERNADVEGLRDLLKTQSDALKSQQEDIENLTKSLKMVLEQPLRKAVTSVAHLPKSIEEKKPLTREAIHARLKTLSATPDLKKSDRQLINDFYDGRIKADALAPLFEDYK